MVSCFLRKCIPKAVTQARYSTITATSNPFSPMAPRSSLLPGIQFLRRCSLPACAVIKAENANSRSTLDWDEISHHGRFQITRMTIWPQHGHCRPPRCPSSTSGEQNPARRLDDGAGGPFLTLGQASPQDGLRPVEKFYAVALCCSRPLRRMLTTLETPCSCIVTP